MPLIEFYFPQPPQALLLFATAIIYQKLSEKLRLEQSVASQHLAILRRAGIVGTIREGKFIFYLVDYTRLEQVNQFVEQLVG